MNVTENGDFHSATVIKKDDASTLMPSTVDSGSRAGAAVYPYPLHDNIKYTAGDFVKYGGKIGKKDPFEEYINNLGKWAKSPHTHKTVKAVYNYLKKGQLIKDLVNARILYLDAEEKLIERWNKRYEELHGERPEIFSVVTGKQESAFVRFNVHSSQEHLDKPWRDASLFESYIGFYVEQVGNEDVCFVTGEILPSTEKHANKLRHAADKAKLISGNDSSGFTFRGRFNKSEEVANISYYASQKAHNALKWLIDKQGRIIDGRVFLIWGNNEVDLASPWENSLDFGSEIDDSFIVSTESTFAESFSKAIDGYKHRLEIDANINVLVIDSATTGRMGVLYYRNIEKEFYFEKIEEWHTTCVWRHSFYQYYLSN